jgi:hypothetical protein
MRWCLAISLLFILAASDAAARHPPEKIGHYANGQAAKESDALGLSGVPGSRGLALGRVRHDKVRLTRARLNVLASKRLRFTFGRGSGQYGFDTLVVDQKGRAEYLFQRDGWKLSRYTIRRADLASLRKRLAAIGYASMPRSYHANVYDGTQWFVKIETDRHNKGVYCDNFFPLRIRRLARFVQARLIARYAAAIKRGTRRVSSWHADWKRLVGTVSFPD